MRLQRYDYVRKKPKKLLVFFLLLFTFASKMEHNNF